MQMVTLTVTCFFVSIASTCFCMQFLNAESLYNIISYRPVRCIIHYRSIFRLNVHYMGECLGNVRGFRAPISFALHGGSLLYVLRTSSDCAAGFNDV